MPKPTNGSDRHAQKVHRQQIAGGDQPEPGPTLSYSVLALLSWPLCPDGLLDLRIEIVLPDSRRPDRL
jgi:hypothetical protein